MRAHDGASVRTPRCGETFLKEMKRRGMETQVKPTKAWGIIAQFVNSGKRKDRKDLVLSLKELLFLDVKV